MDMSQMFTGAGDYFLPSKPHSGTLCSVLNVKALEGAFNQEKALVGAFSVIVQLHRLTDLRHYKQPSTRERRDREWLGSRK